MRTIDLNADAGEGCGNDHALLEFVTSVNIACGGHAGDRATIADLARTARDHQVRVGAHPSYPDPANFGRASLPLTPQVIASLRAQIETFIAAAGRAPAYIKPHGALYNDAAARREVAAVVADLAATYDVALMGPPDSEMESAAAARGLTFFREMFADRGYRSDGTLIPRTQDGALITDPAQSLGQVLSALNLGLVPTTGDPVHLTPDSICVHGDSPGALTLARMLRDGLNREGYDVGAQS